MTWGKKVTAENLRFQLWEVPVPGDWSERAACKGRARLFFPGRGERSNWEAAKRVCARCPVRRPCLDFALPWNGLQGVWGGLTADERVKLRRRLARRRRREAA